MKMEAKRNNCPNCNKIFTKKSNLNRHMKTKSCKNNNTKNIYLCFKCGKIFKRNYDLQQHVRGVHNIRSEDSDHQCDHCGYKSAYKSNLIKHITRVHVHTSASKKKYEKYKLFACNLCEAKYCHASNLYRHKAKAHIERKSPVSINKKCPLCRFTVFRDIKKQLAAHLKNTHNKSLTHETHEFNSLEEFYNWKSTIEKDTVAKFIIVLKTSKLLKFKCHRSGYYIPKGNNKRCLKITGSCKINALCPAVINVKISENGHINVVYQSTHIGHKKELNHIRLTAEERKLIAVQLANKVPHDVILKDIHSSATNSDLQRIHLLNKKDIQNIEKSFNLNAEVIKHPYDPVVVETWARSLKLSPKNSLVAYKPQGFYDMNFGELKIDDFLLVFMTEAQKELLLKHDQDIVCVDDTHNLNTYNFHFYTLLIIEESREGFPVAFMFTNRSDETVMALFFKKLKEYVGLVKPKIFMSDMEDTTYQAWEKVMGSCDLRLYSTWHVLRAWKCNCKNKIKSKEKQNSTFEMLQTLLYELDKLAFHKLLDEAVKALSNDEDTSDFGSYFEQYYLLNNQFKKWAYCYRIDAEINTYMSIENYNKFLNYCYLRGKSVKRLDQTLNAILNLLQDKLFDILIMINKGTIVKKLQNLRHRHKISYNMQEYFIVSVMENKWQVLSTACSEAFTIRKVKVCNNCFLLCTNCNSCFHEYLCSCPDSAIQNNMCEHIHLVARTKGNVAEKVNEAEIIEASPFNLEEKADHHTQAPIIQQLRQTSSVHGVSVEVKKKNIIEQFTKFIEENIETNEDAECVNEYIQAIYPNLLAATSTPRLGSSEHGEECAPSYEEL